MIIKSIVSGTAKKQPRAWSTALVTSAAFLCASAAGVVFAQGTETPDFTKRFYINGGVGVTHIEPESPTTALTVSDNSDSGIHLAVGYDFNRFLTVEGYAADLGTAQIAFRGEDVGSIDYQVFGISALGYLFNSRSGFFWGDEDIVGNFRREGLSLYGRVGLGSMSNSAEVVEYYRDHSLHAAFGIGLEYGFRNGFAVRTEMMALDTDAKYLNIGILKRFGDVYMPAAVAVPAVVVSEIAPIKKLEAPEIPTPAPVVVEQQPEFKGPIEAPDGNFAFDRTAISPRYARDLDALAEVLLKSNVSLVINGHTDWTGSENYNIGLSERRAEAVSLYLQSRGVDADRLITRGFGEEVPAHDNLTTTGRALNRRVEIAIAD